MIFVSSASWRPGFTAFEYGELIMDAIMGGCRCGDIRITLSSAPLRVGICHCLDCRKHHGAVFYAAAIFHEDAVTISGDAACYKGRYFCSTCGSSGFARSDNEVEVHLGTLDEPNQFAPTYESFTNHRENWLPSFNQMEKFDQERGGGTD